MYTIFKRTNSYIWLAPVLIHMGFTFRNARPQLKSLAVKIQYKLNLFMTDLYRSYCVIQEVTHPGWHNSTQNSHAYQLLM